MRSAHDGALQAHERAEPAGHGDRGEPDRQSEDDGDDGSRPRRAGVSGGGVSRLARAERRLLELGVRQVLGPALFHRLEPPFLSATVFAVAGARVRGRFAPPS